MGTQRRARPAGQAQAPAARSGLKLEAVLALIAIIGVLALALGFDTSRGTRVAGGLDAFTGHLDQRVPDLMRRAGVPGMAMALVHGGEMAWAGAYGQADTVLGRPMTTDTPFMVQSLSKSVTAWGVMRLVEDGLIDLDDPVLPHLRSWSFPDTPFPTDRVTFRQLLSHQSGMPLGPFGVHHAPDAVTPNVREHLAGDHARLLRAPGSDFSYSNMGYALLEILIEDVTGRSFADHMREEVLIPLGMHGASFRWREDREPALADGHDLAGRPVPAYRYVDLAGGGLYADVVDMAHFVAGAMDGSTQAAGSPVLSPAGVAELYRPAVDIGGIYAVVSSGYGLGHFIETLPDGTVAPFSGGQGLGWMTHLHALPEAGEGIVILTNSQRSWPLIATLVTDWGHWTGHGSLGMANVLRGQTALRVVVGLLVVGALWQAARLVKGLVSGRRGPASLGRRPGWPQLAHLAVFAVLTGALLWAAGQEYFFLSSVYPDLSVGLGIVLAGVALVSLLSVLLPRR